MKKDFAPRLRKLQRRIQFKQNVVEIIVSSFMIAAFLTVVYLFTVAGVQ